MMVVMRKKITNQKLLNRKEETHERIVEVAARAIRRTGYSGTGVADIMKEAGLTHGGFYAHFDSRMRCWQSRGSRRCRVSSVGGAWRRWLHLDLRCRL
jgi:AcrR family transcriptional regulator